MTPLNLVSRYLPDPETSWAIGTFGAIAEFHREAGEAARCSGNTVFTSRGGIRLDLPESVRVVAWERPAAGDTWTQGIALCLAAAAGAMNGRTEITELGPDEAALQAEDRAAVLFDLGIGAPHCDACVRVDDPAMLRLLRAVAGKPLLRSGVLGELAAMSPVRVFISRAGRLEVGTPIPEPDGKTLDGPHTHLLPDLLKLRRTHAATVPLPAGVVPSAEMFPPGAIHDRHGKRAPFDAARHAAFQTLLADYGDAACVRAKAETISAVRAAAAPREVPSYTRAQRLSRRVALRQLLQTDGPSSALTEWRGVFDHE